MAEFEEKLNAILSDPQAMGQIASLAQALTGEHTGESAPPPAAEPAEAGPAGEAAGQAGATDWSALLGMLGGRRQQPAFRPVRAGSPASPGRSAPLFRVLRH